MPAQESGSSKSTNTAFGSGRRSSAPTILDNSLSSQSGDPSTETLEDESIADVSTFERAVSDLERMLHQTLGATATKGTDKYNRQEVHDLDQAGSYEVESDCTGSAESLFARESTKSDSNNSSAQLDHPRRPRCIHSASYPGPCRRPRLADIVENYSGQLDEMKLYRPRKIAKKPEQSLVHAQGLESMQQSSVAPSDNGGAIIPERDITGRHHLGHGFSLRNRSHLSLRGAPGFNLGKSGERQPIARDWSPLRKRFVASVACISTALIGLLIGLYAGLVPSIQYYIVDESHIAIHGNTGCFLGLALPTFFLWPLPLLHGRKPYIIFSMALAMPLLFPQALAVNSQRLINTGSWRLLLLIARTLMGVSLGFASMNFLSILTDLFGASLMSVNPHQELVDQFDARRHGGGMGVWLGIWTWCWIGSLGIGFLIGAGIIDKNPPAWGFYVSIILIAVVLLLNVACPEVRRSAFRRSVAEVRTGTDVSRRLARGEIMMHRVKTGPRWWGEEAYHGVALSFEMLRQPGFAIMAIYVSWIYAQVVLIITLLGSLASRHYRLRSPHVGLHVGCIALGALLAIPFQKANIFSRSRQAQLDTNRATLEKRLSWSSHLLRRTIFTILLPLAGICYAIVSTGPPISIAAPTMFALCVGFLSCLAVSECNGLIMETFDTSDLSPGMTGRPRVPSKSSNRSNYSSFPRVAAGFAVIHTFAFLLAAGATALGGYMTRTLGQRVATGVVAGILLVLTALLFLVLVRFKNVIIVPKSKLEEMEKITETRRKSSIRRKSMPNDAQALMEEEHAWRPVMIGNPISKERRMNVLELGNMTRWKEIQEKNRLTDEGAFSHQTGWNREVEDPFHEVQRDASSLLGSTGGHDGDQRQVRRGGRTDESQDFEMGLLRYASPESHHVGQFRERDCFIGQSVKEEDEENGRPRNSLHRRK